MVRFQLLVSAGLASPTPARLLEAHFQKAAAFRRCAAVQCGLRGPRLVAFHLYESEAFATAGENIMRQVH